MFDTRKLGVKLSSLRKEFGYSQERLAYMLSISPQAVSKWENGHSIPELSLLPVLAQIYNCTTDEIIIPAYTIDEKIEQEKTTVIERQAERIANHIIQRMEETILTKIDKPVIGMDNDTIVSAVRNMHPNIGHCEIQRGTPLKTSRYTSIRIITASPQNEINLILKIFSKTEKELFMYNIIKDYTLVTPKIYHLDLDNSVLLIEDLNDCYIQGSHFNDNDESGMFIRDNLSILLRSVAKFHAAFWENHAVFNKVGLDWRLENKENILAHINGMEKDFKKYRAAEENGTIPKAWNIFENTIELSHLGYFQRAIEMLREKYVHTISARFNAGKNITIIHGDLHPGNTFVSKSAANAKFIDFQAVRMGLCTEDLAMLLALHIEPEKDAAVPLLEYYYKSLCETVKDYPFELMMEDYKISIMENMFFTVRLLNQGIYDFSMRDRAIRAFETFVLGTE